jgi:Dolichyl-phosphate-mannose-protein mannosyltransferase
LSWTNKLIFDRRIQGLVLLALVLRIAAAVNWHQQADANQNYFRLGDSHGYWVLAKAIAEGQPYQYGSPNASIFRAPLLPLLLAPLTQISDPAVAVLAARLLGAVLGTVAVFMIGVLAERFGNRTGAVAATALASCLPSAIGMSIVVLSEMLFVPLMTLFFLLWHRAWIAQSLYARLNRGLQTGMLSGLIVLTRPSWLLFAPFIAVAGLFLLSKRRVQLQIVVGMALGSVLMMSPWWIRNYHICGKFVLTTLQVGPSLYDGLHQGASGGSDEGMEFMRRFELEQTLADAQATPPLEGSYEWRLNRRAQQAAVAFAVSHPGEVAKLAAAKLLKTWSLWPDGGAAASPLIRGAVSVGTLLILLLAICGSFRLYDRKPVELAMLWAPCLYFTLLHMVFVGSVRYREPAIFVLTVLAGCGLAACVQNFFLPSTQDSVCEDPALPECSDNPTHL